MFAVAWRHNQNSPWTLLKDVVPSEQDARAEINNYARYEVVRREFRIIPLGDADTWTDPVAEQAAREADTAMHYGTCKTCGAGFYETHKGARGVDLCDGCLR